ncbi:hypothetical protein [Turneriella parva]|uniref:Lipoprotein n=1 Tax=Turneriella parva (strain ATCC BAA-1111 / DSM 21527 / NCTC 11395 / H) TaxID=869212 RepID=I4B2Y7_TURPD|nr:hypothetical protein [Turneriella parva]AFM11644.1 hypothetical protein Turpa_0995 [Turneriella parva DSM 21527]
MKKILLYAVLTAIGCAALGAQTPAPAPAGPKGPQRPTKTATPENKSAKPNQPAPNDGSQKGITRPKGTGG